MKVQITRLANVTDSKFSNACDKLIDLKAEREKGLCLASIQWSAK